MLITCPLFGGKNELEVLTRIHDADLSTFDRHAGHVPPELADIVRKSLAREPRGRYQSAREFAQALEEYADSRRVALDHGELSLWVSRLGILPSRSGTHSAHFRSGGSDAPTDVQGEQATRSAPRAEIRRPTPPALSLDDGRAAGRVDLLELVATGRVRRRTKLVGRDGIGRPAGEVPGTAELLRRAAFQFGEPELSRAAWSVSLDPRTLPARLYGLFLSNATGLLVARVGNREKRVFVVDGALRFVAGTAREELLGARLGRRGLVPDAVLRAALETRARCSLHLGEILIGLGAIGPTVLLRELVDQLEERFVELLSWREGTLAFFPDVHSGEDELRTEATGFALVTRGIREHYPSEELAMLLGSAARALICRGDARGLDLSRLDVAASERKVLERAVAAGTLERLVAIASKESLASVEETLRAALIGFSTGFITAPSAGWTGL
jgi:hypothetical protein